MAHRDGTEEALRARIVKPEFFASRSMSRVSIEAMVTFQGLWADADSAGRGVADTRLLKGHIWPLRDEVTPEVIDAHLAELELEHVTLYEVDGESYYAVKNWEKHQSKSYRTGDPVHPEPPDPATCTTSRAPCTTDRALREGKGREVNAAPAHETAPQPSTTDANGAPDERARDTEPAASTTDDSFEEFWDTYPRKEGKKITQTRWKNLSKRDRAAALEALPAHVRSWRNEGREMKYIKQPGVWLNERRWEDELAPAQRGLLRAVGAGGVEVENAT